MCKCWIHWSGRLSFFQRRAGEISRFSGGITSHFAYSGGLLVMPPQAVMSVTRDLPGFVYPRKLLPFAKLPLQALLSWIVSPCPPSRVGCRNALIGRAEKFLECGRLHRSLIDGVSKNKNTCKLTFKWLVVCFQNVCLFDMWVQISEVNEWEDVHGFRCCIHDSSVCVKVVYAGPRSACLCVPVYILYT